MRLTTPAILIAMLCTFASASYSETPSERDLKLLIEQRDKALAAAEAPIQAKFKVAAEQLLRRATQAGDLDAANKINAAISSASATAAGDSVKDLRKQIAGTVWKSVPNTPLRGGLAPTLTFTEKSVEPGGYVYEVDAHNSVTIVFAGGDRQAMTLTKGGKRLQFTHGKTEYAYDLATP